MDRVDRWLNAQRGWRRLLIGWLVIAPAFLDLGLLWSAQGNLDGQATVPTESVLVHVAIAALAGIPLAAMQARPLVRRKKSRPRAPRFSWRMIAAMYVLMVGIGAGAYGNTRTVAWQQQQHRWDRALLLLDAAGLVLIFWHASYQDKMRRQARASARAAAELTRNEQGVAGD